MGVGPQVIELRIPKERRFEKVARASAAGIARQAGLPENRVEDVKTAVSEAVLNAIEHSQIGEPSQKILLTFTTDASRLKIDVKDQGAAFDPGKVQTPCIQEKLAPEASKRGWGLYLIEKLADECNIESVEGEGNTISMVIHLKP
jgi:serine/threonine-protein kinase RsbW